MEITQSHSESGILVPRIVHEVGENLERNSDGIDLGVIITVAAVADGDDLGGEATRSHGGQSDLAIEITESLAINADEHIIVSEDASKRARREGDGSNGGGTRNDDTSGGDIGTGGAAGEGTDTETDDFASTNLGQGDTISGQTRNSEAGGIDVARVHLTGEDLRADTEVAVSEEKIAAEAISDGGDEGRSVTLDGLEEMIDDAAKEERARTSDKAITVGCKNLIETLRGSHSDVGAVVGLGGGLHGNNLTPLIQQRETTLETGDGEADKNKLLLGKSTIVDVADILDGTLEVVVGAGNGLERRLLIGISTSKTASRDSDGASGP